MNARTIHTEDPSQELEELVAAIRARGTGQVLPAADPKAVAALAAHLRGEVPLDAEELAAHEREWQAVEAELRAAELADALADGRL